MCNCCQHHSDRLLVSPLSTQSSLPPPHRGTSPVGHGTTATESHRKSHHNTTTCVQPCASTYGGRGWLWVVVLTRSFHTGNRTAWIKHQKYKSVFVAVCFPFSSLIGTLSENVKRRAIHVDRPQGAGSRYKTATATEAIES